jgi:lipopolysaccharide export system protein LptA
MNRPGADTMKVVTLIHADRLSYNRPDSLTDLQMLSGNVQLKQDNTLFNCDSAVYNKRSRFIEAFGKVHIIDNDTVNIHSDYLQYFVDTKMANLKNNVTLTDRKTTLLTNDLQYDLGRKIGEYHNGGKLINQQSVLTSKEGTYYEELKDVYFKKDVDLKDPKYSLKADSLLYNTNTQIATFIAPTTIIDSAKRTIHTSDGFYDTRNSKAFFGKRPVMNDGAVKIIANTVETDSTGKSILRGNAVYVDTAQGVSVLANLIEANRDDGTFRATLHPLMIIKQDKDSVYITADTLYSGRLSKLPHYKDSTGIRHDSLKRKASAMAIADSTEKVKNRKTTAESKPEKVKTADNKNDSTDRYFQAWHHVRIFSDSMQAVSDSLWYSGKDSIFRLYHDPVMWASKSQITGDTIYLYTKNKNPDKLYVFENGFAINLSDSNMYNQIKGNRLNGFFKNGEIDYMRAQGNAESIYYVKDDKNYLVGINNATSDIIDMRFKNKELNKVVFISDVTGTLYPIRKATEENKYLRGFKWLENLRPKTKFELMEEPKKVIDSSKLETDSLMSEADSLKAEGKSLKPEAGSPKPASGNQQPRVPKNQKPEAVNNPKTQAKNSKTKE